MELISIKLGLELLLEPATIESDCQASINMILEDDECFAAEGLIV